MHISISLLLLLLPFSARALIPFKEGRGSLVDSYRPWMANYDIDESVDNDSFKSMKEICNENGYALEEHKVTTSDGYILTLFRIPGYLNETQPYTKKPVVLLQHGLEADAIQWVINSPDRASAFNLASDGYDVWMGNNRGCQYSVSHTTLDPVLNKTLFWDFDFEDMGTKDAPAEIDFILAATNQEKLSYVGHSEGTTQMFIGLSMLPEYYASRLNLYVALAPVARLTNTMSTMLRLLATQINEVTHILIDELGMYNMFAPNWITQLETAEFCSYMPSICYGFLELFADLDPSVDNLSRSMSYLTHMPSGAGYRNFVHYAQLINGVDFLRYDYGAEKNMQKYNQTTPPAYPLQNIQGVPIALLGGGEDELAAPADVDWLASKLGSRVTFYKQYPKLGHMTFAIGNDMSFFQVDVMSLLKQYSTNTISEETPFI